MADGKVVIETDLDASGIKAGLSKLSGIAQSGIKGTLTAIASAGTALAGLGGAAIKIGADFEEGMSEVQAISRASASEVMEVPYPSFPKKKPKRWAQKQNSAQQNQQQRLSTWRKQVGIQRTC